MPRRMKSVDFFRRAREVHGDRYDYGLVRYKNRREKVQIICRKHGVFEQRPNDHLRGMGCRRCAAEGRAQKQKLSLDEVLKRFRDVHGDRYDYSLVEYKSAGEKVKIICRKHGVFEQTVNNHLGGHGCPFCAGVGKLGKERFIEKAKAVHGDRYDYSLVEYVNGKTPVEIVCLEHGIFRQSPNSHLNGSGCPVCAGKAFSRDKFITRARQVHGDKYDYSKVGDEIKDGKVEIVCPRHGSFWQAPSNHLQPNGCPKCGIKSSRVEEEIASWLEGLGVVVKRRYRGWCEDRPQLEIDIFLPERGIGLEYNGNRWHSSLFVDDYRKHQRKMLMAMEAGIRLLTIQEWLWTGRKKQIERVILNALGLDEEGVGARECRLVGVSKRDERDFFDQWHVHGFAPSSACYGLVVDERLVACMSFGRRMGQWEVIRYASSMRVRGGFSRLFAYGVRVLGLHDVVSYADAAFWTGCSYRKAGFVFEGLTKPNYVYVRKDGRFVGRRYGFAGKGERERCEAEGLYRLYDCGNWKWRWKDEK